MSASTCSACVHKPYSYYPASEPYWNKYIHPTAFCVRQREACEVREIRDTRKQLDRAAALSLARVSQRVLVESSVAVRQGNRRDCAAAAIYRSDDQNELLFFVSSARTKLWYALRWKNLTTGTIDAANCCGGYGCIWRCVDKLNFVHKMPASLFGF